MRLIEGVVGNRHDTALTDKLHRLEHRGGIDTLAIDGTEIARRRFRGTTARGLDVAVALPRDQILQDGAVLALEADYALVLQVTTPRWLRLVPRDAATALELGYNAGNLHWRVRFDGAVLMVALEGPQAAYEARLRPLIDAGAVAIDRDDTGC